MASFDVVVPCYNYGRFLQPCVASAIVQLIVGINVLIDDVVEMIASIPSKIKNPYAANYPIVTHHAIFSI